jgi:hypothetical protein
MVSGTGGKPSTTVSAAAFVSAGIAKIPCAILLEKIVVMTGSPEHPSSPTGAEQLTAEQLRARHQLRPLQSEEEGFAIERLPAGVYGFTYAPGQPEVPIFAHPSYHAFEIHKRSDGSQHILGFLTADQETALQTGTHGTALTLYPAPWETAQKFVSIPCGTIVAPGKLLRREDGNPFHFTLG